MYKAAKNTIYYLLLIIAFLLGSALCSPSFAQQGQPLGSPTSNVYSKGMLSADSALGAPHKKKVYPYFDSTGQLAVVGTVFYYHDGTIWRTPSSTSFDTTSIYTALADSVSGRVKYTDSNTIYVTPIQLKDSISGRQKYIDTLSWDATKADVNNATSTVLIAITDSVQGRVKYIDSTTIYPTVYDVDTAKRNIRNIVPSVSGSANKIAVFTGTNSVGNSNLFDSTSIGHSGVTDSFTAYSYVYIKTTPAAVNADSIFVKGSLKGTVRVAPPPTGTSGHINVSWPANIFSLPNVGTAGTYGSSTLIPVITTDAQGRCSITTTTVAATGITKINTDATTLQTLTTGTTGTDFAIADNGTGDHKFNIPNSSSVNRGLLIPADWSTFNGKESALTFTSPLTRAVNTISIPAATSSVDGYLASTDWTTFNSKQTALSGTGIVKSTAGVISYLPSVLPMVNGGVGIDLSPGIGTGAIPYIGNAAIELVNVNFCYDSYGSNANLLIGAAVGNSVTGSVLSLFGYEAFCAGAGAISHIVGPIDQPLKIVSGTPASGAGNAMTLLASAGNASNLGGALNFTAGAGGAGGGAGTAGGAVNITAGASTSATGAGASPGGAVNITSGVGSGTNGSGGAISILTGGGLAATGQSGNIAISTGTTGANAGGSIAYTAVGGHTFTIPNISSSSANNSGWTFTGNTSSAGNASGTGSDFSVTTGVGSAGTSSGVLTSGRGGNYTITAGAGGVQTSTATPFTFTGGVGGAFTFTGGVGGNVNSSASGSTHIGGAGSAISMTAGNGGNANGALGTNTGGAGGGYSWTTGSGGLSTSGTGGNSGSVTWTIAAPGTGGVASGTRGSFNFVAAKTNLAAATTSYATINYASGTAPTTPVEGDMWADATQKSEIVYVNGIKQARSGIIYTQTADKAITNTTVETSFIGTGVGTITLPANFWTVGKTIEMEIAGIYSTPAIVSSSVLIKIKYGSTVLSSVTTSSLLTNASALRFSGKVLITCRSTGSSGTVSIDGGVRYSTGVAGTIAEDALNNGGATVTLNTTTSNALDITAQWDAATTSRSATSTIFVTEIKN